MLLIMFYDFCLNIKLNYEILIKKCLTTLEKKSL